MTGTHVPADLILASVDSIRFHVHQDWLVAASINSFSGELSLPLRRDVAIIDTGISATGDQGLPVLDLPYAGAVVNLLLCAVYNRTASDSTQHPNTSLADLSDVVPALKEYGIPLQTSFAAPSVLYALMSSYCPHSALTVYAIAASHAPELHHLAEHASQFLLSFDLSTLTDEMASRMGAIYLRRLFMLHIDRAQAFRRLVLTPPNAHAPVARCDSGSLKQAWALATAYLTWSATPDVAETMIDAVLKAILDRAQCNACQVSLRQRFQDLKQSWALVKVSRNLVTHLPIRLLRYHPLEWLVN